MTLKFNQQLLVYFFIESEKTIQLNQILVLLIIRSVSIIKYLQELCVFIMEIYSPFVIKIIFIVRKDLLNQCLISNNKLIIIRNSLKINCLFLVGISLSVCISCLMINNLFIRRRVRLLKLMMLFKISFINRCICLGLYNLVYIINLILSQKSVHKL